MAWAHKASGVVVEAYNASLSPAPPSGYAAGDFLLCFSCIKIGSMASPATPTGWTKVSPGNFVQQGVVWARIADGTSADTPSFTWGAAVNVYAYAWQESYSGGPTSLTGIVHASADYSGSDLSDWVITNSTGSPLVITQAGCLVVCLGFRNKTSTTDAATMGAFTGGSFTNRTQHNRAGNNTIMVCADWTQGAATNITGQNHSVMSINEANVAFNEEGIVIALMPNLNVTATASTSQGSETIAGTGGMALGGTAVTAQSCGPTAAVGHTQTAGACVTGQGSESSGGIVTVPILGNGLFAIVGGMPDLVDSTSLTFRATYGAVTVDQAVFITKAKAGTIGNPGVGAPGSPAIVISVTVPQFMILCYAQGVPVDPNFVGVNGLVQVLSGPTDITRQCSLSCVVTGGAGTVNAADNIPVASQPLGFYRITNITANQLSMVITALYQGFNYSVTVSATKALGGYEIVTTLPTLNNFDGRLVYNSTDGKLYRFVGNPLAGGGWTAAVPALDITGQLTLSQIASVAASTIIGGLSDSQISNLDAAKLFGSLDNALVPASSVSGEILAAIGQGMALNPDPDMVDSKQWTVASWGTLPTFVQSNSGIAGVGAASSGPSVRSMMSQTRIPLNAAKTYRLSGYARNAGGDGSLYLRMALFDSGYNYVSDVDTIAENIHVPLGGGWNYYSGLFTSSGYPFGSPYVILNYGGTTGDMWAGDIRVEEVLTGGLILAGSILAGNIAANTITGNEIAANAITSAKIAAGTIVAANIAAGTILASNIAAATITGDKMSAGAIITGTAQITDGVIISAKIGNLQVNTANIADLTVGTGKISANAISTMATAQGGPYYPANGSWTVVSPTVTLLHTGVAGALPNLMCFGLVNFASAPAGNIQFHMRTVYTDHNTLAALGGTTYYGLWTPGGSNWYGPQTYNHAFHDILPDPGARTVDVHVEIYVANSGTEVYTSTLTLTEFRR